VTTVTLADGKPLAESATWKSGPFRPRCEGRRLGFSPVGRRGDKAEVRLLKAADSRYCGEHLRQDSQMLWHFHVMGL
jgi:hypothetical protein